MKEYKRKGNIRMLVVSRKVPKFLKVAVRMWSLRQAS